MSKSSAIQFSNRCGYLALNLYPVFFEDSYGVLLRFLIVSQIGDPVVKLVEVDRSIYCLFGCQTG